MTEEENSPSCLPQRFLRRGGSFTWTQTTGHGKDVLWTVPSKMLPSLWNGSTQDGL